MAYCIAGMDLLGHGLKCWGFQQINKKQTLNTYDKSTIYSRNISGCFIKHALFYFALIVLCWRLTNNIVPCINNLRMQCCV